jgi:hypothetical protein
MPAKKPVTDPGVAIRIVDLLEKQAVKTADPHLKRILLVSSCEIIDHVLQQQTDKKAA